MWNVPTQRVSLWFPTSPRDEGTGEVVHRDEQTNGREGHEETQAISFLPQHSSQWSSAGMREKQAVQATGLPCFPPTLEQVVSREGVILYSLSSLGVVQEWPHSRLWAKTQSHPTACVIHSKWEWHFSFPVRISWSVARAVQDLTGLVFSPAGRCTCGTMMVFSRCSVPWDSTGMSSQDVRRYFSAVNSRGLWSKMGQDIHCVSGQMESWGSPST